MAVQKWKEQTWGPIHAHVRKYIRLYAYMHAFILVVIYRRFLFFLLHNHFINIFLFPAK
jgi:hypothetical protein